MPRNILSGLVVFFTFFLLLPLSATVLAQDQAPKIEVSEKDIQDFINLLENQEKREALVKQLKILSELKEGQKSRNRRKIPGRPKNRSKPSTSTVCSRYINVFSQKITAAGQRLLEWAPTVPQKVGSLVIRMGDPDFRKGLWTILGSIFGSILFAWIMSFVLKKYLPKPPPEKPKMWKRIWLGLAGVVIGLIPYLLLIVVVVFLFDLSGTGQIGSQPDSSGFSGSFLLPVGLQNPGQLTGSGKPDLEDPAPE